MKTNDNPDTNSTTNAQVEEVQTAALQDDFTKEFIPSTEETEEGYYTFESGVGGYTMLYPVNALMDQAYYQYRGQDFEAFYFWESKEKENSRYYVQGTFEDEESTEWNDSYLNLLIGSANLNIEDFEHYEMNGNDVYFAPYIHEINDNKNGFFYNFFSFVKDQDSNKAMSIIYGANCLEEDQECSLDMEKERKKAEKIIHSIRFNP